MIELCMQSTQFLGQKIKHFAASQAGIFIFATLPGVVGIIVLLTFLSTILSQPALMATLPLVTAFNSAASGYGLIDKEGSCYARRRAALVGIALLLSVTGCVSIILFCPWEPLFDWVRYLTTGAGALSSVFFGAWIADKSNKLTTSS